MSRAGPPYRLLPDASAPPQAHRVTAKPTCASGAELKTSASRAFLCLSQALNSHLFIPIFQKRQQTLLPHKANRKQHILGRPSLTNVCAHVITKYSCFQRLLTFSLMTALFQQPALHKSFRAFYSKQASSHAEASLLASRVNTPQLPGDALTCPARPGHLRSDHGSQRRGWGVGEAGVGGGAASCPGLREEQLQTGRVPQAGL